MAKNHGSRHSPTSKIQRLYDACCAAFSSPGFHRKEPSEAALQRVCNILESITLADVGLEDIVTRIGIEDQRRGLSTRTEESPRRQEGNRNSELRYGRMVSDSPNVNSDSQFDTARATEPYSDQAMEDTRSCDHADAVRSSRNNRGSVSGVDQEALRDGATHFSKGKTRVSGRPSQSQPCITYLHLYECDSFSMGIFCLPAGGRIPLHNHPGMTVLSKLLHGSMHVRSFDWVDPPQRLTTYQPCLAQLVEDTELHAPCPTEVLFPSAGGNIHSFTAITNCAVLDVLSPPYNAEAGRHCTYFQELPLSWEMQDGQCAGRGEMANKEEVDGEGGGGLEQVWLEECQPTDSFLIRRGHYRGPKVIERRGDFRSAFSSSPGAVKRCSSQLTRQDA